MPNEGTSNVVYLIAAYAVTVLGLAFYVLALRRQQAGLAEKLAASADDHVDTTDHEE